MTTPPQTTTPDTGESERKTDRTWRQWCDEQPPSGERVECYDPMWSSIAHGVFRDGQWYTWFGSELTHMRPDYWRPLPDVKAIRAEVIASRIDACRSAPPTAAASSGVTLPSGQAAKVGDDPAKPHCFTMRQKHCSVCAKPLSDPIHQHVMVPAYDWDEDDFVDSSTAARASRAEETYPCEKCGKPRTKAEGGTTFAMCEKCWGERLVESDRSRAMRVREDGAKLDHSRMATPRGREIEVFESLTDGHYVWAKVGETKLAIGDKGSGDIEESVLDARLWDTLVPSTTPLPAGTAERIDAYLDRIATPPAAPASSCRIVQALDERADEIVRGLANAEFRRKEQLLTETQLRRIKVEVMREIARTLEADAAGKPEGEG